METVADYNGVRGRLLRILIAKIESTFAVEDKFGSADAELGRSFVLKGSNGILRA